LSGSGQEMAAKRNTVPAAAPKRAWNMRKFNWQLLLLAVPGLLLLLAFYYAPLFGLIIPFKKIDYTKGILASPWVGLSNFKFFFASQDAWRVTRNTVGLNALFITIPTALSITLALCLFEVTRKKVKIYQTMMFVPYFVSWVVASYASYALLKPVTGVIPRIYKALGEPQPNFFVLPGVWPVILLLAVIWKGVGYSTLLYYATLMGIDATQFEAAAIDGATKWQQVRHISLPFLMPMALLLFILNVGHIFNADFSMFYFLTQDSGPLYKTTDVIDTYVFRALRTSADISMAGAVGLYQSVAGFILVLITNLIVRKINRENSIF